ncbi:unnamed protein product [Caenorhabditis nigoni]
MNLPIFLLCYFWGSPLFVRAEEELKYKTFGSSADTKHQSPCIWNQTQSWIHPYQSITVECCDEELGDLIRKTINDAGRNAKLGNLAKFIQRRAQLHYHMSFESIISKSNFAISTHYHGTHSCRVHDNNHYYLVYETPIQYDPFNMRTEDYLSSIDSADPLGSTKPPNLRGDFPDIREDSTAGEDLSIQPPIDSILQYPNKFAWPDPDEEISKKIMKAEEEAIQSMNELMESVTEISIMNSAAMINATDGLNITEIELPNPSPIPRNFANLREKDRLPENTHCDKEQKDGNKCCDGRLASTMRDAMRHMATSPDFGKGKEGIIASELQQKVQQRFKKSYEVIVSRSDFVVSSYNGGDTFCKFENKGFYILAYSTPKQYDIDEKEDEMKLAATSNKEPLGSNETMFDNEAPWHIPLQLERSGERAGYPVGSHCTEARTGSKCCSLILFNAMKTGYDNHVATSNFDAYDIRNISKAVQWSVEEVLQHSAEVIVSLDDFAYATYNNNSYICKYRVDKYYMLAYTTPNHDLDDYDEMALTKIETEPEAQLVFPSVDRSTNQVPFQNTPAPYWTTPRPIPTQVFQPIQYTQQPVFQQQQQQPVYNQQQQFFNQQPMYHLQPSFNQAPLPYHYPGQPSQFNPFLASSFHRSKRQIGASPYPIHQNVYNDIGSAKPFNCPAGLSGLSGMACCDGGLQFEANKVIDQAKQAPDFDKHNTRNLAKLMTRAVQKRFGTTFESIVAEADFSWGTNKFNGRTCKIDNDGYTALTYQSSSKPPPPSDFLDIPGDPTLGGPTGSSGGGGGGGAGGNGGGGGGGGSGGSGGAASADASSGGGGNGGGGNGGGGNGGGGNGGAAGNGNGAAGGNGNGAAAGNGNGAAAGNGNGAAAGNGNGAGAGDASAAAAAAQAQAAAAAQAQAAASAAAQQAAAAAAADAAQQAAAAAAAAANSNDAFSALAAAAGGACFSLDTWVTTPSGKKRMDQIDIGDYVLTAGLDETYFTPITLWIHREPERVQEFLTIMTEYGKTLRMTARHFMYRNKCGTDSYQKYIKILPHDAEAIFAEDLRVGDCVVVMYRGKFHQQKIESITKNIRTGIYSPLTNNGRIIVNDMLSSCYSEVQQNTLQTTFFWACDKLRNKLAEFFGDLYNNKIELPTGTTLSKEIMSLVLPIRK